MIAVVVWALSGHAHADGPVGLDITELIRGAADHATAGATFRGPGNWRAKLFVSDLGPRTEDEGPRLRSNTTVGAQLSLRLTRSARVNVDVFNVFNHKSGEVDYFTGSQIFRRPGSLDGYLTHPAEGRGFRMSLTARF